VATFLANVGVNCSHRVRSPLNEDGTFELRPIPERVSWAPPMLKLPEIWGDKAVHLDPDLSSAMPTYGDNCRSAARAFSLRSAREGDEIRFLARLTRAHGGAGFYEVGKLVIADILQDVAKDPGPGWWDGNAHIRRARATGVWNAFWVFKGGPRTALYEQARPFTRSHADEAFGHSWFWRPNRTELQTIGSYTRTIRRLP
jgi:hypothetical protein